MRSAPTRARRVNGAPGKAPECPIEDRDQWIRWRLENWGAWARGREYLGIRYPSTDNRPDPVHEDAERVERAMVLCRRTRPRFFDVAIQRYVFDRSEARAADALRMSIGSYRVLLSKLSAWTDGMLQALDGSLE